MGHGPVPHRPHRRQLHPAAAQAVRAGSREPGTHRDAARARVSVSERAVNAAAQKRVTPIGAAEIEAAREYFTGLHTRLGDAWQSLDPASPQRRDEWTRPPGEPLSGS